MGNKHQGCRQQVGWTRSNLHERYNKETSFISGIQQVRSIIELKVYMTNFLDTTSWVWRYQFWSSFYCSIKTNTKTSLDFLTHSRTIPRPVLIFLINQHQYLISFSLTFQDQDQYFTLIQYWLKINNNNKDRHKDDKS